MKAMKCIGLALVALGVTFTTGCERHSNKEVFYLVSSNMALPYWQTAAKGFNKAAAEYKVTAKVVGPKTTTRRQNWPSCRRQLQRNLPGS